MAYNNSNGLLSLMGSVGQEFGRSSGAWSGLGSLSGHMMALVGHLKVFSILIFGARAWKS